MTLLVRDEEDIIEDNLWFHHEQGIDNFIITNNLSTDRTAEIIKSMSRELDIEYIYQPADDYSQHKWVTEMARRASHSHGADWVINNDADEFWKAETGTMKTFISQIPQEIGVLNVRRYNAVVKSNGSNPRTAEAHQRTMDVFECTSLNSLGRPLLTKCIHRAGNTVIVKQGNHDVEGVSGDRIDVEDGLSIFHYPHRTLDQYNNKISLGGAAYAANTELSSSVGATWRKQFQKLKTQGLDDYWADITLSKQDIAIGLRVGTLFRDTSVVDTLRTVRNRPKDLKFRDALKQLQLNSQPVINEVGHTLAGHFSRTPKEKWPSRPLYYNLEFCVSGPERQSDEISELQTAKSSAALCKNFAGLRDTYSLFPKNTCMKQFFSELLEIEFPETVARLRADCKDKVVVLHTSCESRKQYAKQSIASFAEWEKDHHHILLIGEKQVRPEDDSELSVQYDGQTLIVPVPDNYESLHRKVFYALTLLDLLANPAFVLKLDDDLFLGNGPELAALLEDLASQNVDYAGRLVGAIHHKDQWHGWHLSKCEDPMIERRGYQFPLPRQYAAGGYGYVLGRRGLEACSNMYLSMKEFFSMRAIGLEDVYVGHAIYAENQELYDVSSRDHLLTMPGLVLRHFTDQNADAKSDSETEDKSTPDKVGIRDEIKQSISRLLRRAR